MHRNIPSGIKMALKTLRDKYTPRPSNFQTSLCELISQRGNDRVKTFRKKRADRRFYQSACVFRTDRNDKFLCDKTEKVIKSPSAHHQSNVQDSKEVSENKCSGTINLSYQNNDEGQPSTSRENNIEKNCQVFKNDLMDEKYVDQLPSSDLRCINDSKTECSESREERARNVIIRFLRLVAFKKRVKKLRINLKERIDRERRDEIEKRFEFFENDGSICKLCGIPVSMTASTCKSDDTSYGKEANEKHGDSKDILTTQNPVEESNVLSVESDLNEATDIQENPFELLLHEDSRDKDQAPENVDIHIKSKAHLKNVQDFSLFKSIFCDKIFDTLLAIERFIEIYDLRNENTQANYKEMSFYIPTLCKQSTQLKNLIDQIIQSQDWCNSTIQKQLKSLCYTYDVVRDRVRNIGKEKKKVSFLYQLVFSKKIKITLHYFSEQ
jgi:hypothetical protein